MKEENFFMEFPLEEKKNECILYIYGYKYIETGKVFFTMEWKFGWRLWKKEVSGGRIPERVRIWICPFVSALSLGLSFFFCEDFPFDPAWVAVLLCGVPILKEAAEGLVKRFDIKADLLVATALLAALWIGEVFAAGEVALIMILGERLEERTVAKARSGIEKLLKMMPRTARKLTVEGGERVIPASELLPGDLVRILAGEAIPADGRVRRGYSSVDQSVMTGESLPVDKAPGDFVSSGTVNQFGVLDVEVVNAGEKSLLGRMIRLAESAEASKSKIVRRTDRWAGWIVLCAMLAAIGTWLVTGEVIRSVSVLVVFCPCALVLATPTAMMAGIGNASSFGVLIRNGGALEALAGVSTAAFDKTGTLTEGNLSVTDLRSFLPDELSSEELLRSAALLESCSEHPAGKAIGESFLLRRQKVLSKEEVSVSRQGRCRGGRGPHFPGRQPDFASRTGRPDSSRGGEGSRRTGGKGLQRHSDRTRWKDGRSDRSRRPYPGLCGKDGGRIAQGRGGQHPDFRRPCLPSPDHRPGSGHSPLPCGMPSGKQSGTDSGNGKKRGTCLHDRRRRE